MIFQANTKIFPALIKARGEVSDIVKDARGNYGKYATLAGINEAIQPALAANGLAIVQEVSTDKTEAAFWVTVETWLIHASGEYIQFAPLALPVSDTRGVTAQSVGSATTYGRRYALMAALNLSADDDDGQAATNAATSQHATPAPQRPQQAPEPPRTGNEHAAPEGKRTANPAPPPPAHAEVDMGMGQKADNPFDAPPPRDGWSDAWAAAKDFPHAMEWGRARGQWNNPKHFDNAWRKCFREHEGHKLENAAAFLAAWREVVNAHANPAVPA